MPLLRQNARLRKHGIWNWSLPAWAGRFEDGRTYNACPSAGICAKTCYARSARNFICCKEFVAVYLATRDRSCGPDRPIEPPELGTCPTSSV
ncbi:hypothetical protein DL990_40970 [Amycolatopsis sp. WAC 01416]|uniref:GP88 family protein n=1 Tax=Amycolatopsis sp. WAC 01416 TaxID=2203196 RepID=UPI000F793B2F|nr:hypothetical protein [Amycolatopsis sp. WAC 01416]RSN19882.1 hypothetical protein DL990_40970 [Amycolatopsis sp. WAC 01416]